MKPEIFHPDNARILRRYTYERTPEVTALQKYTKANVAIINASDKCSLTCPNCMFAAPVADRIYAGNVPSISIDQSTQLGELFNQAEVKLIVFSGGGESVENIDAVERILQDSKSLEECAIITSGYFATSSEETAKVIDRVVHAIQKGAVKERNEKIKCIFRLSYDRSHDVPTSNIENIIRHVVEHQYHGVEMHVVIRTLLSVQEHRDEELATTFNAQLQPLKDPDNPFNGVPVIDGFPTRWLCIGNVEIPIIYKPTYFEGFAEKRNQKITPATSWREVKQAEEEAGTPFNLGIRGPRGEGHNYYETILHGHSHWKKELGGVSYYVTPKDPQKKELCLYIPADGRVAVNATAPDANIHLSEISTWQNFLAAQYRDILQMALITRPTEEIVSIAEEVESDLQRRFDQKNFVFAIPRLTLETPEMRLYLVMRLMQDERYRQAYVSQDPVVRQLVSQSPAALAQAYGKAKERFRVASLVKTLRPVDPIIGHEPSIFSHRTNSVPRIRKHYESVELLLEDLKP